MNKFKFQSRWKEELIVVGKGGEFILEHPMGILSVYLPSENVWKNKSLEWAKNYYCELSKELEQWCIDNKVKFVIDETAGVGFDGK